MPPKAGIGAVVIVTTSSEHYRQIEAAPDAGKHVQPLDADMAQCKQAETAVERHPGAGLYS